MPDITTSSSYKTVLKEIKQRVYQAQYKALQAVNRELIQLYWFIGETIVHRQDQERWGKSVVEQLSKDLQSEFPAVRGFSVQNLWYTRSFYRAYKNNTKLQSAIGEIPWTHNLTILDKCKDDLQKEFYLKMTKKHGWSVRTLQHMIAQKTFERWALEQTNIEKTPAFSEAGKGEILVKDEYNLDFLQISQETKERELEDQIVKHIITFMNEMGMNLMFVGRQKKITIGQTDFYLDLLFYHKKLKSYVVVELKADKFKHEYASQLELYLHATDDFIKDEDDNPSIGILLCKQKDRALADYSLKIMTKPMGLATYKVFGERSRLPENIRKYLPDQRRIAEKLSRLMTQDI